MFKALAIALFTLSWMVAVALAMEPSAEEASSCTASALLARMWDSSKSVRRTASGTEISCVRGI